MVERNVSSVTNQIISCPPLSSHFEVNNPPQNGKSNYPHSACRDQQQGTFWISEQHSHIVRIQDTQDEHHENRQRDQDPSRQPALCRAYPHFPVDSEPVANHS